MNLNESDRISSEHEMWRKLFMVWKFTAENSKCRNISVPVMMYDNFYNKKVREWCKLPKQMNAKAVTFKNQYMSAVILWRDILVSWRKKATHWNTKSSHLILTVPVRSAYSVSSTGLWNQWRTHAKWRRKCWEKLLSLPPWVSPRRTRSTPRSWRQKKTFTTWGYRDPDGGKSILE